MDFSWIKDIFVYFIDYLKFWVVVNHYEEAIVLRNGKYHRTLSAGLWPKWTIFEYYITIHIKPDTMEFEPITITTLDGETAAIGLEIEYEVVDSKKYMVETNDAPSNMRDVARGEMSELLEDLNWNDIRKKATKNALKRQLSAIYEGMGVKLNDLKFTNKAKTRAYRLFSDKGISGNAI